MSTIAQMIVLEALEAGKMNGTSGRETRHLRLAFLKQHPEMLDWPHKDIVREMKRSGVLSKSTYWMDVHLHTLIRDVRACTSDSGS